MCRRLNTISLCWKLFHWAEVVNTVLESIVVKGGKYKCMWRSQCITMGVFWRLQHQRLGCRYALTSLERLVLFTLTRLLSFTWKYTNIGIQITQTGIQIKKTGIQITQTGIQITQTGIQITQTGIQITQTGIQITQTGIQIIQT